MNSCETTNYLWSLSNIRVYHIEILFNYSLFRRRRIPPTSSFTRTRLKLWWRARIHHMVVLVIKPKRISVFTAYVMVISTV